MADQNLIRGTTRKGQVTIPVEIRRLLGIKPQDRVVFSVVDGRVTLSAAPETLRSAFGAVEPLQRPEDFGALRDRAIEDKAARTIEEMGS